MVEEDWYAKAMEPVVSYLRSFALVARSEYFTQNPKLLVGVGRKGVWWDGFQQLQAPISIVFFQPCSTMFNPKTRVWPCVQETYLTMTLQFISWVLSLILFLVIVFIFTELLKFVQRVSWRIRTMTCTVWQGLWVIFLACCIYVKIYRGYKLYSCVRFVQVWKTQALATFYTFFFFWKYLLYTILYLYTRDMS